MTLDVCSFRRAQADDLPAILMLLADDPLGQQLEEAEFLVDQGCADAFAVINADPNQLLVVIQSSGKQVVGTLQLTFIPGLSRKGAWRGHIEAVRVAASHRRSGLGQRMIEWAIVECRARGCGLVQLTTAKYRLEAHRFYERLGFVASHLGYKMDLSDHPTLPPRT